MLLLPAAAFSALGLLIGSLAGLTVSPIVVTLVAALFAFVGGSAVAFVGQLDRDHLRLASVAVFCLSIFMLAGLVGGILVKTNSLFVLDPTERALARQELQNAGNAVLRNNHASLRDDLKASVITGEITLDYACNKLGVTMTPDERK
jgi:hypothetical protein